MSPTLLARSVSRRFGRQIALCDVNLFARAGEVVGIIGPNGAGKTTLLRIVGGLLTASAGSVERFGLPVIRYFGGERTLPPEVSARRWYRLWNRQADPVAVPRCRFGVLSRGTRQRLGLEAVLSSRDASLILLDEPWEGLDPDAARWLTASLVDAKERGAIVIVSSHRIHDLAVACDRFEFLVRGRVATDYAVSSLEVPDGERVPRLLAAFEAVKGSL